MRRALSMSCIFLCLAVSAWGGVGGSVSGTVLDAQGGVIPNATITLVNTATNARQIVVTDDKGVYSFRSLGVETYELQVVCAGFKPYRRTGITVNANDALIVDVALTVGEQSNTVTVKQSPVTVDTASTQLGEVITGGTVDAVPLNGRSFTDLLSLQPGVAPQTTITGTSVQAAGASTFSPSGYLNPGTISINGQREYANGFTVNDADVVERFTMGAAVVPNLDSIAEFRVLTGNFNAEYGNYSGGRINVITKSGANQFHGSAFEFLRNTNLDAKNFFSQSRGAFQQNQFGGTFGGPVIKDKIFFYTDFQGTRLKQGVDTGNIAVPSADDRTGKLGDLAGSLTGTVNGQSWADQLSQRLGYTVRPGEAYYTRGCATTAECVLPNAVIPQSAFSAPANYLLKYIPVANSGSDRFSTSAENLLLHDNKGSLRMDANTRCECFRAIIFSMTIRLTTLIRHSKAAQTCQALTP